MKQTLKQSQVNQSKVYANKPIMEIKWNTKNCSINQKKAGKEEKGDKEQRKQITNILQDCGLKSSHINNYIRCKWSNHLN